MTVVRLVVILISILLEGNADQGLYDENDKVFILNQDNFYQSVYDQTYASNVMFYRNNCGHCQSFAPIYKAFAEDVYGWREIVHISVIDCANDINIDICRDMNATKYPTIKYFPPLYHNDPNNIGIEIERDIGTLGEPHLLELLEDSSKVMKSWPNLQPINSKSASELFSSVPMNIRYILMVYDVSKDPIVAQKVAIDFRSADVAQIRRVVSANVAKLLGTDDPLAVYVGDVGTKAIEIVKKMKVFNRTSVRSICKDYLKSKGIDIQEEIFPPTTEPPVSSTTSESESEILQYVKDHPELVFYSDIDAAIRHSIFNELVKYKDMNDEQIVAARRYLSVLQRYE